MTVIAEPDFLLLFGDGGRRHDDRGGFRRHLLAERASRQGEHEEGRSRRRQAARSLAPREGVEREEGCGAQEVGGERGPKERDRRREAEREARGSLRVERLSPGPLREVGRREEEHRGADGKGGESGGGGPFPQRPPAEHDPGEGRVDRQPHGSQRGAAPPEVQQDIGESQGGQRHDPGPGARQPRAGIERKGPERNEVGRMRKQPGKGAEENEQDRGRHSNLPFDETELSNGSRERPALREFEGASVSCDPVREACRPAGLLASGSSAVGLLPGRATGSSPISRVQWIAARGVPGDSGGGRVGISPTSLGRTIQRAPKGPTIARRAAPCNLRIECGQCGARTTRSTSIGSGAWGSPRSSSPRERRQPRSPRSAASSRAPTTSWSRA